MYFNFFLFYFGCQDGKLNAPQRHLTYFLTQDLGLGRPQVSFTYIRMRAWITVPGKHRLHGGLLPQ